MKEWIYTLDNLVIKIRDLLERDFMKIVTFNMMRANFKPNILATINILPSLIKKITISI